MNKYFTIVGSRETPDNILKFMELLSYKLCVKGYIPRSGGADGADTAGEDGWWNYILEGKGINEAEIYIPWDGFNKRFEATRGVIVASELDNWKEAQGIASKIHPVWENLKSGAKSLHTRNIYQVLGKDLATPSKFLVCYAKPQGDSVSGGTRTAYELAKQNKIPCFNLYDSATIDRINKFLES